MDIYEAPSITTIGSLHDMTLQFKTFGANDGTVLTAPGGIVIGTIGEDNNGNGYPIS